MINFIKKHKIHYKIASLVAALFLWVYVMGVQNLEVETEITRVPVGFIGESTLMEERGLVLLSGKEQTVNLTLRGNRNSLVRLSRSNISIEVNLDSIDSAGSVNVRYTVLLPESGVTVVDRSPSYITLKADKITKKTVPVKIAPSGSLPSGYALGTASAEPSSVTIEGPSEQLKDIDAAQVVIDTTGARNTLTRSLDYTLVNQAGETQNFPLVKHGGEQISVVQRVNMVKEIPLTVGVVEGGFALLKNAEITILPETVTIAGDPSVLGAMESLDIGTIRLAEISRDVTELEFPLLLPEGMSMVEGQDTARVKVQLVDVVAKTFVVTQVRVMDQELPENFEIVLPVLIELKGDEDVINAITGKDIWLEVNLNGIRPAPGTYDFPAAVIIEGVGPGIAPTKNINVSISVAGIPTKTAGIDGEEVYYEPL